MYQISLNRIRARQTTPSNYSISLVHAQFITSNVSSCESGQPSRYHMEYLRIEVSNGHDVAAAAGAHRELFPVPFVGLRAVHAVRSRPAICTSSVTYTQNSFLVEH